MSSPFHEAIQKYQGSIRGLPTEFDPEGPTRRPVSWDAPAGFRRSPGVYGESAPLREDYGAQEDYYSLGDWNYQEANDIDGRGPDGQPLPPGAIAWDAAGRAYYGDGIAGIAKKWWSSLHTRPNWLDDDEQNTFFDNARDFVGTTIQAGLDVAQTVGARPFETAFAAAQGLEDIGEGSPLPQIPTSPVLSLFGADTELFEEAGEQVDQDVPSLKEFFSLEGDEPQKVFEEYILASARRAENVMRGISLALPPVLAYNAVRALTSPLSVREKTDAFERNLDSSRLIYTGWMEPATMDEYVRRSGAGESPGLLAIELMNPGAEFAGEVIFDLFNVVGAFRMTGKTARQITTASDVTTNVSKVVDDAIGMLRNAGDDARAGGAIENLVSASMETLAKRRQQLNDLAYSNGVFALTATSKRAVVGESAATVFQWVSANAKHVDDVGEILTGLALRASDDVNEVRAGVSLLTGSAEKAGISARPLFSQAGDELAILLRETLVDGTGKLNPTRFLDDLAEASAADDAGEAILELAQRKMGPTLDSMFPTITERIASGEQVSPVVKALARFDDKAQGVYKPVNSFFANIYMGMSPGYAFRNWITNGVHIFVDEGPANLFNWKRYARDTEDWLNFIPAAAKREFTTPAAAAGVDPSKAGIFGYFLRKSGEFEQNAAQIVMGKSVNRTMRRMMQPGRAIPDVRPLVEAGLSDDAARTLTDLVIQYRGNYDEALKHMERIVENGNVPVWRLVSEFADPEDLKQLEGMDMLNGVEDILKQVDEAGGAEDEVIEGLRGMLKQHEDLAARVDVERTPIAAGNGMIDDAVAFGETGVPDTVKAPFNDEYTANENAMVAAGNAADEGFRLAREFKTNNAASTQVVDDIVARHRRVVGRGEGTYYMQAKAASARYRDRIAPVARQVDAMSDEAFNATEQWTRAGLTGDAPQNVTRREFVDILWEEYIRGPNNRRMQFWRGVRDRINRQTSVFLDELAGVGVPVDSRLMNEADGALVQAMNIQDAVVLSDGKLYKFGVGGMGERIETEIDNTTHLLNAINANLPEGKEPFKRLSDVSPKIAREALGTRTAAKAGAETAEEVVEEVAEGALTQVRPPYAPGALPSRARVAAEQHAGVEQLMTRLIDNVEAGRGLSKPVDGFTPKVANEVASWAKEGKVRFSEAQIVAAKVGTNQRDFTLLNYGDKMNLDSTLAYVYPYQFWYNRTYAHWTQRVANNPALLAAYAKYKNNLSIVHAGAPEWWKYQINSNEILGLESDNPLFFNLEATLNPLHGLTGVDFDDRYKRTNWFTGTLDSIGKMGPSTWTPFSVATALAMYAQGEEEAAARWAGRLFPQTATIRAVSGALGSPIEVDPFTQFFSGGVDPHERRRIGRTLAAMESEGVISPVQAADAAFFQEGNEDWNAATIRASQERAPGQMASFFLGVGFRARTGTDMEIDEFYNEYYRMWNLEPDMTPDEFRGAISELEQKYPFMNTLTLSRKGGVDRDRMYSYQVLNRIPPAQGDDFEELMEMPDGSISRFYDDKGHIEDWVETDTDRFMAGIVDLGAILDLPPSATSQEWENASASHRTLLDMGTKLFGDDIWDRVDNYYGSRSPEPGGGEAAEAILNADPVIGLALDWKALTIMNTPTMASYYTSIEKIENYYKGQMWGAIEQELGDNIWDKWDVYWELKDANSQAARQFWKDHPELARYGDIKDEWLPLIAQSTIRVAEKIRPGEGASLRDIEEELSVASENALAGIQGVQPNLQPTAEMWRQALGDEMFRLVTDTEDLPPVAERRLEELGISREQVLQ